MHHHLKKIHSHLSKAMEAIQKHHEMEGAAMREHHPIKARLEHKLEGKAMHMANRMEHKHKKHHATHAKHHGKKEHY